MKPLPLVSTALLALLATSGCQTAAHSPRKAQRDMPQVIIPAVTSRPIAATAGLPPGVMYHGEAQPVAVTPASRGVPVYTPPKIVKTVLAAYEDEKGRLFGPQVMYEKVAEGAMNVEALQNPELAYIPQENLVIPPGMGNPVSSPAAQRAAVETPSLPVDNIDPRDVIPTGLMSNEANRAEADRMAIAAGRRAVFDHDIGWVLVPVAEKK